MEQGETSSVAQASPRSYRNRIVSMVSIGLVIAGGAVMVSNRHASSASSSSVVTDLKESAAAPKGAKAAVMPVRAEVAPKKGAVVEKDVDGGKPVSKKTAKPTFKPTLAPKPTMKPVTGKPQEKPKHDEEPKEDAKDTKENRMEAKAAPKVISVLVMSINEIHFDEFFFFSSSP